MVPSHRGRGGGRSCRPDWEVEHATIPCSPPSDRADIGRCNRSDHYSLWQRTQPVTAATAHPHAHVLTPTVSGGEDSSRICSSSGSGSSSISSGISSINIPGRQLDPRKIQNPHDKMRFGKTLREAIIPEWRDHYIDYAKLKSLLREDRQAGGGGGGGNDAAVYEHDRDDDEPWTERDEIAFSEEIFNVQLENVALFQEEQMGALTRDVDRAGEQLREITPAPAPSSSSSNSSPQEQPPQQQSDPAEDRHRRLRDLEVELDDLTNRVRRLKSYSNINYTGFLKMVKKHDRKRGTRYKMRPLMNVRLAARPFNSEQAYSPLLNRLSVMYYAIRQQLEGEDTRSLPDRPAGDLGPGDNGALRDGEKYTAHKFWVHRDNLLEVRTFILRRLPALVYHSLSSETEIGREEDPTITSLYLDSPKFDMYADKAGRTTGPVTSVRLRWHGQLADSADDIYVEKKSIDEHGASHEQRFTLKQKHVKPYLDGTYRLERAIHKMEQRSHAGAEDLEAYRAKVEGIQRFIEERRLSPVLRANYVRSAFQKPGDDRVRISIDTNVAFVREDTLDPSRPCRSPDDWHRTDIEQNRITYPFRTINQSEVSLFPHAILEIKVKKSESGAAAGRRPTPVWVEDLMSSHLVHKAAGFSKFLYGVATLFDDHVNTLPFWVSEAEQDIRRDPQRAHDEEEQRRARLAEEESAMGTILGIPPAASSYVMGKSSPVGVSFLAERVAAEAAEAAEAATGESGTGTAAARARTRSLGRARGRGGGGEDDADEDEGGGEDENEDDEVEPVESSSLLAQSRRSGGYGTTAAATSTTTATATRPTGISSFLPNLSLTRYGIYKRKREQRRDLPEGVEEPAEWIKNEGELNVEPKVWLANERTFIKWQHISILIGALALAMHGVAATSGNRIAEATAIGYMVIAVFTGWWGYTVLRRRQILIRERSGKDFDFHLGPILISGALAVALILNLYWKWQKVIKDLALEEEHGTGAEPTVSRVA